MTVPVVDHRTRKQPAQAAVKALHLIEPTSLNHDDTDDGVRAPATLGHGPGSAPSLTY
ncbi:MULTISPECIES: deoxyribose-phosphate aldolase [unclassified Burkholderia]|uniref:deoxyribose-phosphate aldolase n=1 Tax=unclassified Burkholderia TaxID=2613784 RepID=UPI00141E5F17|nr:MULTISPECIES: deoxyribose-phosphate aldolase [unclassified Burkholderia]NIE84001.1 deoxyribose-phosphate aldolase [Burkholderia sp. Tr-860]NIF62639.1 deoxyribose-phosphate aldolase [Burkholderia sp. Cy-647]NIF98334.1 deoxyribose-phosphate aldolase [Burkholderia sp. Ax-1720]